MSKIIVGDSMKFGEILRQTREQLNLSQESAAKSIEAKYKVRLSAAYLSMIENGVKTNLTVNLITALLDYFLLPLTAASSLFIGTSQPSQYGKEEPACSFHESQEAYPSEGLRLPEEAQLALKEFRDFLQYKYDSSKKSLPPK